MLRNTAFILVGSMILSLVIVIVYALLGIGGPENTILRAEAAWSREEAPEAIRLLDLALLDSTLLKQPDLRRRALRLRAEAHRKMGNFRAAIQDLDVLIEDMQIADLDLVLERISLVLARAAVTRDMTEVEDALDMTEAVLARHEDNPKALAIAGHACRLIYNEELRRLEEKLTPVLPAKKLQKVMPALRQSLFRRPEDPQVAVLNKKITAMLPDRKNRHEEQRGRIRAWISRGRAYFLQALRGRPAPLRAFEGMNAILLAAGLPEQQMAQAMIFLQSARPKDAIKAATMLAKLHLDQGRNRAAVATANRVLHTDRWNPRSPYRNDGALGPLLLAKHMALRRLKDTETLGQSVRQVFDTVSDPKPMDAYYSLLVGMALAGIDDDGAMHFLGLFCDEPKLPQDYWTTNELLAAGYSVRIEVEARTGAEDSALAKLYEEWGSRDRSNPTPLRLLAKHYITANEPKKALRTAEAALSRSHDDEEVLRVYAEAAQAFVADSHRDLPRLIQRCRSLSQTVPDNIGDIGILALPLAQYALDQGELDIAAACARLMASRYAWARWPRYIAVEAALAMNEPNAALRDLEVLLEHHHGDRKANELLSRCLAEDPKRTESLRYASAVHGAPNLSTALFLARRFFARGEWDRVLAIASAADQRFGPNAELMSLFAKVLLERGLTKEAADVLATIHKLPESENNSSHAAWALGQYVLWNPNQVSDAERLGLLVDYLEVEKDGAQLAEVVAALLKRGLLDLARRAADSLVHSKKLGAGRRGAWFQLAAQVALQQGRFTQARDLLVAAAGLGDAAAAALDLTLLNLIDKDLPAARESFRQCKIQGLGAAAVAARLGDTKAASAVLQQHLEADPHLLPALCLAACLDPEAAVPTAVMRLAKAERDELLELLACLEIPGFGTFAHRRALAMVTRNPKNPVAALLGARALVATGQDAQVLPTLLKIVVDPDRIVEDRILREDILRVLAASNSPELRDSRLMDQLVRMVMVQGDNAEPALLALIVKHDKRLLSADNPARSAILSEIARFWMRNVELAGVGMDEVDVLVNANMPRLAMQLMEVIGPKLEKSERPRYLRTFFRNANALVKAQPVLAEPMVQRAHKVLEEDEPYGEVLDFMLTARRYLPEVNDAEALRARRQQDILYLRASTELYRKGQDTGHRSYVRNLARLAAMWDDSTLLQRTKTVLQQDPSLLDIWVIRAKRMVQANQLEAAIDCLSWITAYLSDDSVEDALVPLLLRQGTAGEHARIPTAHSRLARGLLALRTADCPTAVALLSGAEPQPDGAHLFFLALSQLGLRTPEGTRDSARSFGTLARLYPRSPLSYLALDFAAQLENSR